ncbi:MAG: MMPL family transporter [Oscillospiraceae bacterium]|jgi:predicted RND superfamily exporter protein|nr:MMPL family transporter [Oscillospiraceae bacterium]
MEFLSRGITDHRRLVTAAFIVLALVCALAQFGVEVNYDLAEYLPENTGSSEAIGVMESEFTQPTPNARVMIRDVGTQEALAYKERLAGIDGVSGTLWLDDVLDLKAPVEMADSALVEQYYKDRNALISLTIREGDELGTMRRIYDVIGDGNALSGEAVGSGAMQITAGAETTQAMLILLPLILIILLLSTTSWLEPLLFFAAIGVSVIVNMGTNILFGGVSFITQAISPILQLAVSLDYAIFLLHAFEDYRGQTDDAVAAMRMAMKRAFPSVAASAATTLFGFLALVFMDFRLGADLGLILAKGIVLSFISVMTFLPALTLCCRGLLDKTRRRKLLPAFKAVGRAVPKVRAPVFILVLALIIPAFLAQRRNEFIYGFDKLNETSRSGYDAAATEAVFGPYNPIVLLVPKGSVADETLLAERCASLPNVTGVMSYTGAVGDVIPNEFLDAGDAEQFYSENFCRIVIYSDTDTEGDAAFALVDAINDAAGEYYGQFHTLGSSVVLRDMKDVVTRDNTFVNFIAIASILAVLAVTFRSAMLPVILLMTIESAIWLNLSVPYFTATPLCYIGYLVISTVQLGATVDYAILLTDHYRANRRSMLKLEAIRVSLGEVFASILVSGLILALAGFTLGMTSTNPIVSDMGILLGRGAVFSMLLVVCFLPAALVILDKPVMRTTHRSGFLEKKG